MSVSLCVCTYHVHNNYITYIVAMWPYLSQLRQFSLASSHLCLPLLSSIHLELVNCARLLIVATQSSHLNCRSWVKLLSKVQKMGGKIIIISTCIYNCSCLKKVLILYMHFTSAGGPPCNVRNNTYIMHTYTLIVVSFLDIQFHHWYHVILRQYSRTY